MKSVNSDGVLIDIHFPNLRHKANESFTPSGQAFIYRADLSIEEGRKIAKIGQKLDLDAMIQAAKASTDIAAIVARAKMGDDSVLHVNPGFVGDSVNLPKDLYDYKRMNDLYDKVSASFGTLPPEVQALFGNSSEQYLNDIISGKAEKIVNDFKTQQNQPKEGEGDN